MDTAARRRSSFFQLFWKEYREQRAFWLAILLIFAGVQGIARLTHRPYQYQLLSIALIAVALYAAGSAATTFATEYERKTFAFLRGLRCSPGQLVLPKLAWTLASMLALQAALLLSAGALNNWELPYRAEAARLIGELFGIWGLAAAEALAWGVCCSMLSREPLRAALATILATTLEIHIAGWLSGGNPASAQFYTAAIPLRLVFLALVVGLDCWLAPRWSADAISSLSNSRRAAAQNRLGAYARGSHFLPSGARPVAHLSWQTWRTAWPWTRRLIVFGLLAMALECATGNVFARLINEAFVGDWRSRPLGWVDWSRMLWVVIAVATLCGVLTFQADQQHNARRFLAERGVSARQIWLSRQLVWLAILAIWSMLAWAVPLGSALATADVWSLDDAMSQHSAFDALERFRRQSEDLERVWGASGIFSLLSCVPLAFAAGQLASLLIESSLLAALFGYCGAAIVVGWAILIRALEIPATLGTLPILIALFAGSWLRAPAWLVGQHSARSWLIPLAPLAGVAIFLGVLIPVYREHQIPHISFEWPAGSEPAQDTPAGRETVRQYLDEWQQIADATERFDKRLEERATAQRAQSPDPFFEVGHAPPDEIEIAYVDECRPIVAEILATSRREQLYSPNRDASPGVFSLPTFWELRRLLIQTGAVLTSRGQFDEAWECYCGAIRMGRQSIFPYVDDDLLIRLTAWAAQPGQTAERIHNAIEVAKPLLRVDPNRVIRQIRSAYRDQVAFINNPGDSKHAWWQPPLHWFGKPLPENRSFLRLSSQVGFERARAQRLLDAATFEELRLVDRYLREGPEHGVLRDLYLQEGYWVTNIERWARSTPLYLLPSRLGQLMCWEAVQVETHYRATLIIMALEAWKHEHGDLPERLDQLEGVYFDRIPSDPRRTGNLWPNLLAGTSAYVSFHYFPDGLPFPSQFFGSQGVMRLRPGRPFLWSGGIDGRLPETDSNDRRDNFRLLRFSIGASDVQVQLMGRVAGDIGQPFLIP